MVPQSFGDLLLAHPHAHALCSLGLLLQDGTFHPLDDADFSALEAAFRERVFVASFPTVAATGGMVAEDGASWASWPGSASDARVNSRASSPSFATFCQRLPDPRDASGDTRS